MKLQHCAVNFEDDRGTITDIFVHDPKDHGTIIFTKKGAVRGNHFHKISQQHDFIVSGSLEAYGQKMGEKEVTKIVLKPYDLVTWELGEAHEFVALEDCVFLTLVDGVRGGEDYEKDTHRLDRPLHELFQEGNAA
jgi:dTDP-4-dehydrorhamnose 3,5-epimerase-like enzyme